MNTPRPLVCLYSDANFLALSILESLLSKNSQIVIVTNDPEKWEDITRHLINKSRFSIVYIENTKNLTAFNYSIFCGGYIFKKNGYGELKEFMGLPSVAYSKCLVILPFEIFSQSEDNQISLSNNLSVVYTGDLIGARIDLDSDLLVNKAIARMFAKKELRGHPREFFCPVFVSDATRSITKWLFSFGPFGKKIFLLGPKMSLEDFWSANQKVLGKVKLRHDILGHPRVYPENIETQPLNVDLNTALMETYGWLGKTSLAKPVKAKSVQKKEPKRPKFLTRLILLSFFVLVFPFLTIGLSFGLVYFSLKDLSYGKTDAATNKVSIARTLFLVSQRESGFLMHIPAVGRIYKETAFVSDIGKKTMDAFSSAIPTTKIVNETFNNILGDAVYNPDDASQKISAEMELLYQDTAAIQSESIDSQKSNILSAGILLNKVNFDKIKNYFSQGKVLAENLPSLLGKDHRKTYLVLFQNNMELRPTGGFIGSFGLLSFDGGRMVDLTVNDVYSADGQLIGHVEPPVPIKNYLNEANWWLRDSNWDPDFPTSAERAEWFLDKEMDTQVDGVMAIDLKTVSEALKVTGPIYLPDYNLNITTDNLYQKTQAEADTQFFPGSHNKASFLTALSRSLITDVEKLNSGQKLIVLESFLNDFQERHIQAFLHDDSSQNAISALGWGGEVANPNCGSDCYADLVGLVEANVGVNKANFFITRNVDLNINSTNGTITRRLTLTLNNSANIALGPSGIYKVYIRTFIPDDSDLIGVKMISGANEEKLAADVAESHGRQEIGVYTQILNGQSKKIEFSWATNSQQSSDLPAYGLYIRKQAGISDDPWHIVVNLGNASLTDQGVYTYNTVLARDFLSRFGQ